MSKYLYGLSAFVLAFVILSVSVLRSCSVSRIYAYGSPNPQPTNTPELTKKTIEIDYVLPYPGKIAPDNWLWYLKASRDKLQYLLTTDKLKKAELNLLYSDKRLGLSLMLFENKKPDIAIGTMTKGEKYLERAIDDEKAARESGINTTDFLTKLAKASLMHRQVIEEKVMPLAPEDIKPEIVKSEDYAKETYKVCRDALNSKGIEAPKDPFNGQ